MNVKDMFHKHDPNDDLPERQGLDLMLEEGTVELDEETLEWVYTGPYRSTTNSRGSQSQRKAR